MRLRRKLLLIGSVGTAFCLAGVAWIFKTGEHHELLIWLLVAYIAFFAFSQGSVIWVYISEVFPNKVRAKGQSLGSFTHWAMAAIVSGCGPPWFGGVQAVMWPTPATRAVTIDICAEATIG